MNTNLLDCMVEEAMGKLQGHEPFPHIYVGMTLEPVVIAAMFEDYLNRKMVAEGLKSKVHFSYNGMNIKVSYIMGEN